MLAKVKIFSQETTIVWLCKLKLQLRLQDISKCHHTACSVESLKKSKKLPFYMHNILHWQQCDSNCQGITQGVSDVFSYPCICFGGLSNPAQKHTYLHFLFFIYSTVSYKNAGSHTKCSLVPQCRQHSFMYNLHPLLH